MNDDPFALPPQPRSKQPDPRINREPLKTVSTATFNVARMAGVFYRSELDQQTRQILDAAGDIAVNRYCIEQALMRLYQESVKAGVLLGLSDITIQVADNSTNPDVAPDDLVFSCTAKGAHIGPMPLTNEATVTVPTATRFAGMTTIS